MLTRVLSCHLHFYCLITSRTAWSLVSLLKNSSSKSAPHPSWWHREWMPIAKVMSWRRTQNTDFFFCPFGVNEQIVLLYDVNLIWENRLFKTSCHCLQCCKHKYAIFSKCNLQEPWFVSLKLCKICNKVHRQLFCTCFSARGTGKKKKKVLSKS